MAIWRHVATCQSPLANGFVRLAIHVPQQHNMHCAEGNQCSTRTGTKVYGGNITNSRNGACNQIEMKRLILVSTFLPYSYANVVLEDPSSKFMYSCFIRPGTICDAVFTQPYSHELFASILRCLLNDKLNFFIASLCCLCLW